MNICLCCSSEVWRVSAWLISPIKLYSESRDTLRSVYLCGQEVRDTLHPSETHTHTSSIGPALHLQTDRPLGPNIIICCEFVFILFLWIPVCFSVFVLLYKVQSHQNLQRHVWVIFTLKWNKKRSFISLRRLFFINCH